LPEALTMKGLLAIMISCCHVISCLLVLHP
jgi:hypothetical protein